MDRRKLTTILTAAALALGASPVATATATATARTHAAKKRHCHSVTNHRTGKRHRVCKRKHGHELGPTY